MILCACHKDRCLGSFNLFEDHTVEDSHSRRKLNDSKKCNSMISLGTKLSVQPLLLKKICAGGFVSSSSSEVPVSEVEINRFLQISFGARTLTILFLYRGLFLHPHFWEIIRCVSRAYPRGLVSDGTSS